MSTARHPPAPPPAAAELEDPGYGWRTLRRRLPDGREVEEVVPLTIDGLLHPEEEDEIVQGIPHATDCHYLWSVARARLARDPTAVVLTDIRVAWDPAFGVRPLAPDLAVFLDCQIGADATTFDVVREQARAVLVIEVTSPESRAYDLGIKVQYYHRLEVPLYVVVDARERAGGRQITLRGHRWAPGGYEPIASDDLGRIWLEPLGVWIGGSGPRVACYDGATGAEIGDYLAISQALGAEAEARAAAERARDEAEARVRELEAELRRLRGGA